MLCNLLRLCLNYGVWGRDIKVQELIFPTQLIKESSKDMLRIPKERHLLYQKKYLMGQAPRRDEARIPNGHKQIKSVFPRNNYPSHKAPPSKPPRNVKVSLTDHAPQRVQRKPHEPNLKTRKTQCLKTRSRSSSISKKRRLSDQGNYQKFRHTKGVKQGYQNPVPRKRSRSSNERRDHRKRPVSQSDRRQKRKRNYKNPKKLKEDRPLFKTEKHITGDGWAKLTTGGEEPHILTWRNNNYVSGPVSPQEPVRNFSKHYGQRPIKETISESNKPSLSGECVKLNLDETQNQGHIFLSGRKDQDMNAKKEILKHAMISFVHKFESNIPSPQNQKMYLASLCSDEFLKSLHKLNDILRMYNFWKVHQANLSRQP